MSKRLLILGAGGWGQNWVRVANSHPAWTVAAYADANPAVLERLAAQRGIPRERLFTDWRAALEAVPADAVTITVPNPHRLPILEACLRRGLHILADKPLVHSPADARQLLAWAQGHAGVFMVAQNYRLFPEAVALKALLESGQLGPIGDVRLHFLKRVRDAFAPTYYAARLPGWLPLGLEMGIHHWDLMRYFLAAEPTAVRADAGRHDWSWGAGFTVLDAHVLFPGSVSAAYDSSWDYARDVTGWPGHWEIRCREGALTWGPSADQVSACDASGRPSPVVVTPQDSMAAVFERFTAAVENPTAPAFCPLQDNLKSLALAWAAQRSVETGQTVEIESFLADEGLA